jgi:glutamine synthetase
LSFVDILGINKSVTVPVAEIERALDGRVDLRRRLDRRLRARRGSRHDARARPEHLRRACPGPAGGAIEARLICDIATPDGEPFEGCPRTALRRALEDAGSLATALRTGLEIEFYLFKVGPDGSPTTETADVGSYFDVIESDRGEDARTEIAAALEAMGLSVASAHHEHGAGQHEIDLNDAPVMATADALVTARIVAKHIAARHGLHATFMPKPLETLAGSGVHVYLALGGGEPDDEADGTAT